MPGLIVREALIDMAALFLRDGLRATGVVLGILQGRVPVFAKAPDIALHTGLSCEQENQYTDQGDDISRDSFVHLFKNNRNSHQKAIVIAFRITYICLQAINSHHFLPLQCYSSDS